MSAATGLMTAGFGVQGIVSGVQGFQQAAALRDQGRFAEARFDIASRMSEIQAEEAERVGEEQVAGARRGARQLAGAQRAAIAAGNVDVLSGSAAQARRDVEFFSDLDEITIRDMARQRAFGMRVQAQDFQFQGAMARGSAETEAGFSVMRGVSGALASFTRAGLALEAGFPTGGGTAPAPPRAPRIGPFKLSSPTILG